MHVFRTTGAGGPEVLSFEERADLTPGPSELLVRVRATALNRADLLQLRGTTLRRRMRRRTSRAWSTRARCSRWARACGASNRETG